MIQAHGYMPSMIYAKAGAPITKHMAVCIKSDGNIYPSDPSIGPVLGFALASGMQGSGIPVQTEGLLYGYEGPSIPLKSGYWYYQSTNGRITQVTSPAGVSNIVAVAINRDTLQIRLLSSGGSSSSDPDDPDTEVPIGVSFIYDGMLVASFSANKYITILEDGVKVATFKL